MTEKISRGNEQDSGKTGTGQIHALKKAHEH